MKTILEFAYTGRVSWDKYSLEEAFELSYVCYKFSIFGLLTETLRFIGSAIGISTVGPILKYSNYFYGLISSSITGSSLAPAKKAKG